MNSSPTTMKDEHNSTYHQCKNKWMLYSHLPHDTDWSLKSYQNIIEITNIEQLISIFDIIPDKMIKN